MPLSPAVSRSLDHVRTITCTGYRRDDGLWDIEGHLTDTKSYDFDNEHRGRVEKGEAVHDMCLRLTLDDAFLIHDVEAVTDASPYSICPDITGNFSRLKGLTIGSGWRREVRTRVGGVHGCTHLVELLGPMATTAYQTIHSARAGEWSPEPTAAAGTTRRPRLLNSCHAFGQSSPVVARNWPEYFQAG